MSPTCVVTGGSGYVGSQIVATLVASGWHVRSLSRRGADPCGADPCAGEPGAPGAPGASGGVFNLTKGGNAPLEGASALVHAAYQFSGRDAPGTDPADAGSHRAEDVNLAGSRALFDAARRAGVETIVHISSVAAFPGCRSSYGMTKLAIEDAALAHGGIVVRPGLVWGDQPGGVFGALRKVVTSLPVVPLFVPDSTEILLAHEADVAALVASALGRPSPGARYVAASRTAVSFRAILLELARSAGRRPALVRVPWQLAYAALRGLELGRVPAPFRSDSLLSLVHASRAPFAGEVLDGESLGVEFRDFIGRT